MTLCLAVLVIVVTAVLTVSESFLAVLGKITLALFLSHSSLFHPLLDSKDQVKDVEGMEGPTMWHLVF